jgi:YVTN family beta-propeller protein
MQQRVTSINSFVPAVLPEGRAAFSKKICMKPILTFFCVALSMFPFGKLRSQGHQDYVLEKKIPLPGDGGYDYLYLDKQARRLYVSHGDQVDVLDLATESLMGSVTGMKGVHGIAIAGKINKGFISDGDANAVVVFDPSSFKIISTIPLTGKDPDAITYDSVSERVFAFNGHSDNVSVIDVNSLKEIALVPLNGGPEFAVPDHTGKIYLNLEDKNALLVLDSKALQVMNRFSLSPCGGPTGLALDLDNQRAFSGCRTNRGLTVTEMKSGKVVATIPIGAGVDAVAYDKENRLIFCSNGDGTTTVIHQDSPDKYQVIQTIQTQYRAKTMALDPQTHKIYLSVVDFQPGTKTRIRGTFKILVFIPPAI